MPDAVGVFADAEDYCVAVFRISEREGIVGVGAEPGVAGVKASADGGVVVVEDNVFAVYAAG